MRTAVAAAEPDEPRRGGVVPSTVISFSSGCVVPTAAIPGQPITVSGTTVVGNWIVDLVTRDSRQ